VTFVLRTLSTSYVRRHPGKTVLAVVGIAIGVAVFVAVRAAQDTLAAGLRRTVDRLADAADLQITGPGGVPETLRETLHALDEVDADSPVIEQVVQPDAAGLGSLLVLGVDLVSDHRIRAYAFEGDAADVDDPLVFLAQPDSIAVSRTFASRAGLRTGDAFSVRIGPAIRRLTVRALLDAKGFAGAYGGNVAVTDVYAAEDQFGRGRHFDRIDVRLRSHADVARATAAIARAIGPGYRVEPPDQRGADLERIAGPVVSAFGVMTLVALGLSVFLIFNVFAIGVERRRRDIGILRAFGATPAQIGVLFLVEAAVLGVIGAGTGVILGSFGADELHALMGSTLQAVEGVRDETRSPLSAVTATQAMLLGSLASLAGAWMPARRAARVKPVDATSTGVFAATPEPLSRTSALVGLALLALAGGFTRWGVVPQRASLALICVLATLGTAALAGHAVRLLLVPFAPVLAAIAPASGRLASDALQRHARRTAASAAVLVVLTAFVLGASGFLKAVRGSIDRWMDTAVLADVIVRASPGVGASAVHLSADLAANVSGLSGVAAVDAVRNERIAFRGRPVTLVVLESGGLAAHALRDLVAGDGRAFATASHERRCLVSDVFARRFAITVGDVVTVESPTGPVQLPVAAIIGSFRGLIVIDRSLFLERWHDDRVDTLYVAVTSGADPSAVRSAIRSLAGDTPALVSMRREVVEAWGRTLTSLDVAVAVTVSIALIVAFLGVASSLLVSAVERAREVGVLRAIGATPRQIGVSIVLEGLVLTLACLALAVPTGELLAWFLRVQVSDAVAAFRFPRAYPTGVLQALTVGLPLVGIVATWLPVRWATSRGHQGIVDE
jgi:putative ABC transport system permease protein